LDHAGYVVCHRPLSYVVVETVVGEATAGDMVVTASDSVVVDVKISEVDELMEELDDIDKDEDTMIVVLSEVTKVDEVEDGRAEEVELEVVGVEDVGVEEGGVEEGGVEEGGIEEVGVEDVGVEDAEVKNDVPLESVDERVDVAAIAELDVSATETGI